MNYLELQESIKAMTREEYIKAVIGCIQEKLQVTEIVQVKEPYNTHFDAKATITLSGRDFLATSFTLAGWYGATVQAYYQMTDKAEITLDINNGCMPLVKIVRVHIEIKHA